MNVRDEGRRGTRKPAWLKVKSPHAGAFRATSALLDDLALHTVCSEARCPNKGECFASGTATFLVLGDRCSRSCRFCSVDCGGALVEPDADEPRRVAAASRRLGLTHVVVTSVTRDDLADGGAAHFAAIVAALRRELPRATVEVLVPDFRGRAESLAAVLAARPDVLGHNLETVPRLYEDVRPKARYDRSLELLARAAGARGDAGSGEGRAAATDSGEGRAAAAPSGVDGRGSVLVKTGLMLGLGETPDEVRAVLADCAAAGADIVTLGQYLQPDALCLPVARYVTPAEFDELRLAGEGLGLHVVAGPFVRSSYRAGELLARA